MTDDERDQLASKLVDRFSLWSGAAGLIPLPVIDMATVGGVQLVMLRRLSEIYGVPFSENLGKSLIASLAGSMVPASTAFGLVSALKAVPAVGTAIGTLAMPAFSAGATYIIGKVFIQHFASGGTLLDFNPPDYREFIRAQKEKLGIRSAPAVDSAQPASTPRSASSKGAAATSA
ncbi:MAG: YcjF family protein [Hyphomicrobiales bacterium]